MEQARTRLLMEMTILEAAAMEFLETLEGHRARLRGQIEAEERAKSQGIRGRREVGAGQ